jgi:hypothetical protein
VATVNPNDTDLLALLALEIPFTYTVTPETPTTLQRPPATQALDAPGRWKYRHGFRLGCFTYNTNTTAETQGRAGAVPSEVKVAATE